MSRYIKVGYDKHTVFTEEDLREMYLREGKSPVEAADLAKNLYSALRHMTSEERNSWRRARQNEVLCGLEVESC